MNASHHTAYASEDCQAPYQLLHNIATTFNDRARMLIKWKHAGSITSKPLQQSLRSPHVQGLHDAVRSIGENGGLCA